MNTYLIGRGVTHALGFTEVSKEHVSERSVLQLGYSWQNGKITP